MIPLVKSTFYQDRETKAQLAAFILHTERLSMGIQCQQFEEAFAKKQQCRYAVFVNSGSSANLILIQALLNLGRLKKGDRVGISALTWATNVMPLLQLGLLPVAIDCERETLNVSPRTLREHLVDLKGLFLTNVLGFCDRIEEIKKMCSEQGVLFLEDNCEALGSCVGTIRLGNVGLAGTFSFFVGHHLSTIEGGMVCTDDTELYHMLVRTRAHGWDRKLPPEEQEMLRDAHVINPFFAKYTFYDLAYNTRPTEINGFLGNTQLQYWDEIVHRRAKNWGLFFRVLRAHDHFIVPQLDHMSIISAFAVPVITRSHDLFETYKRRFEKEEVEIRPIIAGDITQQPFYKKYIAHDTAHPNAAFIHSNGFYFTNSPELTEEEVERLSALLES